MKEDKLIGFKELDKKTAKIALREGAKGKFNVFVKNPITGQIISVSTEMFKKIKNGEDVYWEDLIKEIN